MLSINKDYFLLRKPLERRLYEIARKHCGDQKEWRIRLENLFNKSGSSGTLAKFRFNLKTIMNDRDIPDYQFDLDQKDMVTITRIKEIEADGPPREELTTYDMAYNLADKLKRDTINRATKIHRSSDTDWSMHEIMVQFLLHKEKKGEQLRTLDGAFLNFVKTKVQTYKKDSYNYV